MRDEGWAQNVWRTNPTQEIAWSFVYTYCAVRVQHVFGAALINFSRTRGERRIYPVRGKDACVVRSTHTRIWFANHSARSFILECWNLRSFHVQIIFNGDFLCWIWPISMNVHSLEWEFFTIFNFDSDVFFWKPTALRKKTNKQTETKKTKCKSVLKSLKQVFNFSLSTTLSHNGS